MDGRKGCFSKRCGGVEYDKMIINRMMLRFRPIAPKPPTAGSDSGGSPLENTSEYVASSRAKRARVRCEKNKRCQRERVRTSKEARNDRSLEKTAVTLQLLPENTSTGSGSQGEAGGSGPIADHRLPIWYNINTSAVNDDGPDPPVVESWVTVECVTDKYIDGGGMGSTDVEKIKNLEADTCPGFLSDGLNRVRWVNQAYRTIFGPHDNGNPAAEALVRLVVKEELPVLYPAFACKVRVEYTWQKQKNSQTMPCDVWRIDLIGFAWRLDVKAALSLGR